MFTSSKSTIETLQKVSVFIVSFEQVNIGWDSAKYISFIFTFRRISCKKTTHTNLDV